jgi:hypothetical protein
VILRVAWCLRARSLALVVVLFVLCPLRSARSRGVAHAWAGVDRTWRRGRRLRAAHCPPSPTCTSCISSLRQRSMLQLPKQPLQPGAMAVDALTRD